MKPCRVLAHLVDQRGPIPLGKRLTMLRIPRELPTAEEEDDRSAQVHAVVRDPNSGFGVTPTHSSGPRPEK
jgi:hypothetical protein